MELQSHQRRYLIKLAQKLKPIVYVGKAGVAEPLEKSLAEALDHHELVKVKFIGFKDQKKELSVQLAEATGAAVVRVIGNIAILYLENPDEEKRIYTLPGARNK